ncbi:MAG: hypothetical protein HYV09_05300 [Deltaproteobacteria bacterium]|nr:hypothetical protein [Deltaproteobacteria bacterium]
MKKIAWVALAAVGFLGCTEEETIDRASPDATSDAAGETTPPSETGAADAADAADAPIDVAEDAADAAPVDGGTEADCLDGSPMDAYFTLEDTTKCLVARYDVPVGYLGTLTWGRHGGPLGLEGGATPNLVRYELPAAATGAITIKKTAVPVTGVPSGAFWGSQAIDLPFFGWTAFSYTGTGTGFPGELLLVNTSGALTRYHVNGYFAGVGLGQLSTSGGRLLHTSLSSIGSAAGSTNEGGLYAADSCGSASTTPRLLPAGDTACKDPIKVATWEAGSSGPIAVDPDENLFAILSKFGGNQELRGFERSTVARGSAATAGTKLFADTQYTNDLVADGKAVYWQPNDATTYSAVDPKMLEYKVEGKTLTPVGSPKTFLKMKTAGSAVTLIRDSSRRVWVGVAVPGTGDAGPSASVLFVLRAKKP